MALHYRLLVASIVHSLFGCVTFYPDSQFNLLAVQTKSFINESVYSNYGSPLTNYQAAWFYSILSSINLLGSIICYPFLSYSMEKFGRKGGVVYIKNCLLITGSLMSFCSVYSGRFELLFAGTILAGCAMPFGSFHSVYLNECAPVISRGFVSILPSIGLRCWMVIGMAVGLPQLLGTEKLWHFVFIIPVVSAAIHLLTASFLPESPRHLHLTVNKDDMAAKSLKFYHGSQVNLTEIFNEYDKEKQYSEERIGLRKILKTKHLKWPFLLSVSISLFALVDGVSAVGRYSTTIMSSMFSPDDADLYAIVIITLPSLLIMLLGLTLITKIGRKPILLIGVAIAIIGTILVAASDSAVPFMAVIGMFLINVGHCIGPSIIQRFISAELCPQISRSATLAFAEVFEECLAIVVLSLFAPLVEQFGNKIMIFFTVFSSLSFVFLFMYLPETHNRTVTQVIEKWLPEENNQNQAEIE